MSLKVSLELRNVWYILSKLCSLSPPSLLFILDKTSYFHHKMDFDWFYGIGDELSV